MKKTADHFRCIGLVGNTEKPACAASVRAAAKLITAAGRKFICHEATAKLAKLKCDTIAGTAELARQTDLLVVFGGDGTMLHAARQVAGSNTPILGVNIGGLGFLTAVQSDHLGEALKQVWKGEYKFETRALIEAVGISHGKKISALALNDIVVTRGAVSRLISLDVSVNDELVTRYRCDGLIVSSPTGSTAYSLAAGGAIVLPTADVFALTPICPHALSNRSIILPLSAKIRVKAVNQASAFLNADGRIVGELQASDEIIIRRSRHSVRLMRLGNSSFLEAMRRKLHWRGTYV
ncbi:MAG TPA: NAD(+)/NADH kinase [Candidatus Sulfotelmatobacter sp.]|nr:NAD(+)/NADH kinase [Candidatus Sulfotelmatobacter sp.]